MVIRTLPNRMSEWRKQENLGVEVEDQSECGFTILIIELCTNTLLLS